MDAGLVFELSERTCSLHGETHRAVSTGVGLGGGHSFRLQAVAIGVSLVHAEEVTCPNSGLIATGSRSDLHDHVALVIGVFRHEGQFQLRTEPFGFQSAFLGQLLKVGHHFGVVLDLGELGGLLGVL